MAEWDSKNLEQVRQIGGSMVQFYQSLETVFSDDWADEVEKMAWLMVHYGLSHEDAIVITFKEVRDESNN